MHKNRVRENGKGFAFDIFFKGIYVSEGYQQMKMETEVRKGTA